ncbi:MAG: hypothetical protein JWN36_2052 [Microbacteriaceae bacterium]|nr:hypothetical protein [Microbacteriaceae bacterium]
MGFFDRLLGREDQPPAAPAPRQRQRSDDEIAVERYEYLLRTAPPETIEKVHAEAFAKLTPEQRDILFDKLTANADAASDPSERPADAAPATLAKAATRAELQQPGTLTRTLGGGMGGMGFAGTFGSSLLGSVAGYVIGSALVSAFMPMDFGGDASADAGNADPGTADNGDAGTTDASAADFGGADSGGWDFGGGGDFGGGDFF